MCYKYLGLSYTLLSMIYQKNLPGHERTLAEAIKSLTIYILYIYIFFFLFFSAIVVYTI